MCPGLLYANRRLQHSHHMLNDVHLELIREC